MTCSLCSPWNQYQIYHSSTGLTNTARSKQVDVIGYFKFSTVNTNCRFNASFFFPCFSFFIILKSINFKMLIFVSLAFFPHCPSFSIIKVIIIIIYHLLLFQSTIPAFAPYAAYGTITQYLAPPSCSPKDGITVLCHHQPIFKSQDTEPKVHSSIKSTEWL